MKAKTKKLFLTLFAFASLSLAACGGSSSSSSSGTSEGSSSGSSSQSESQSGSSEESSEEESSEEESSEDPDDPEPEGDPSDLVITVGSHEVALYQDEAYVPGDTSDMAAAAKYYSRTFDVEKYDVIDLSGRKDGYGFGPNGDGDIDKNNILRPAEEPYKVHNDAQSAKIYVYEYDGVTYGTMAGYSFWLTGHNGNTEDEDVVSVSGIYLAVSSNDFKADDAHKFSLDEKDSNHYYFHTTFVAGDEFKVYDTSKDSEDARWVSNASSGSHYTINPADGNLVVTEGGEYYVDYYVNTTENHISLYKVEPVVPGTDRAITLTYTSTAGNFKEDATYVYAWVWGGDYGNGEIIVPAADVLTISDNANGFLLLATNTEVAAHSTTFPENVVRQSANLTTVQAGTLSFREMNQEGKAVFAYVGDVPPTPDPSEHVNYLMVERGEVSTKYELENYNDSEYKLLKLDLKADDEFSICVHVNSVDVWMKYTNIKPDTDASVKAKFTAVEREGASNGNFKVVTAGTFDFYVARDGSVVYIANYSEPVVNHYTIKVGSAAAVDLVQGSPFTDGNNNTYEQWYKTQVTVAVDDVISFKNNDDVINPVLEANTKFEQDAETKAIKCKVAGVYDFWVKLRYQDDKLYIGDYVEPAANVNYVITGASFDLNADDCKVFAWVWGSADSDYNNKWVAATIDTNPKVVKITLPGDVTGFKLVRVNKDNATGAWSHAEGAYNQTGDIAASGGANQEVSWSEIK